MEINHQNIMQRLKAALTMDGGEIDEKVISQCAADAALLVGNHIGGCELRQEVAEYAATEVAREMFTRLAAPGGVYNPFGDGAAPVRLARDPLTAAYPILRPFMPGGFA